MATLQINKLDSVSVYEADARMRADFCLAGGRIVFGEFGHSDPVSDEHEELEEEGLGIVDACRLMRELEGWTAVSINGGTVWSAAADDAAAAALDEGGEEGVSQM